MSIAKTTPADNSGLFEPTVTAICEAYVQLHGPCTEERLTAVLKVTKKAIVSFTLFQLTMRGQLIPSQENGELLFEPAECKLHPPEPMARALYQVLWDTGVHRYWELLSNLRKRASKRLPMLRLRGDKN